MVAARAAGDNPFAAFMTGSTPTPTSQYCVLMDAASGKVLYERNPYVRRAPASTTKIMSATLILEHCNLDDLVAAPAGIEAAPESSLHLRTGERISVRDILYGMMLRSANDAAIAAPCTFQVPCRSLPL
jgi:D-alanyl-D-alanine carboxypeptidase (penicillin-binding protein 5/6)